MHKSIFVYTPVKYIHLVIKVKYFEENKPALKEESFAEETFTRRKNREILGIYFRKWPIYYISRIKGLYQKVRIIPDCILSKDHIMSQNLIFAIWAKDREVSSFKVTKL